MASKKQNTAKQDEALRTFRLGIVTTPKGRRAWEPVRTDGTLTPSLAKLYPDHTVEKFAEVRAASFRDARTALENGKGEWSNGKVPAKKRTRKPRKKAAAKK